ncbi:hypothetical protein ONS95_006216 [Cadophora gregata]|uniref:uncharacterized protein n=1 Tax=Cadophora gregata TaxID=51156 RepID=UPI0026DB31F4|nr:uncharacterized protein ONS95_006216 [Cadophora gregata]KAK0102607.1 hypothetical protein ONS95_006216 [Cadophora gregata]
MCQGPQLLYLCGHPTGMMKYLYCDRERKAIKDGREYGLCDQCPDYERGGSPQYRTFKCKYCVKEERGRERAQKVGIEYIPCIKPSETFKKAIDGARAQELGIENIPAIKPSETFKKAVDGGKNIARRMTGGLKRSVTTTFKKIRAGTMNLVQNHQKFWDVDLNRSTTFPVDRQHHADVCRGPGPSSTIRHRHFHPDND